MKNLKKIGVVLLYVAIFIIIAVVGTKKVVAAENAPVITELKEKEAIHKIIAKGNVEIFLTQGNEQSITIHDNYYGKNALTQIEEGVLRISSHEDKKLTLWITVKDLEAIEAYDQALIYGTNDFQLLDLAVTLGNDAVVNLNLDAYHLNTNISGNSKLTVKGKANYQSVYATDEANIDISKFQSNSEEVNLNKQASITVGKKQSENVQLAKCESLICDAKNDIIFLQ
jgi:hypothetical protein